MKRIGVVFIALILLAGCTQIETPQADAVSGRAFKGPFLPSSTVDLYVLNSVLNQTGVTFHGNVTDEAGSYYIPNVPTDGAIELIVNGYFFNEVSGEMSDDVLELKALTSQSGTVNVNLFTTIEIRRVRYLAGEGLSVQEAKEQALQELSTQFHWTMSGTADEISLDSANGKCLLAFSSMIADSRNVAEIGALITELTTDFEDGVFTEEHMDELTQSCFSFNPLDTRANLQGYFDTEGINIEVPFFGDEINTFLLYDKPSDYIYTISNKNITLDEQIGTIDWRIGHGYQEKFWLSPGTTMSIEIVEPDDHIMTYNSTNTMADGKVITADGDGIVNFDAMILYSAPIGYEFDIDITINGETHTNHYRVVE